MAALFTEDGTWDTAFGKATGRAAIAELASSLRTRAQQPRPRAVHLVTNIAITLDGEHAGGAYLDEMVRSEGSWRFSYRKIDRFIAA